MKLVDLSRVINGATQVCPFDKPPRLEQYLSLEEVGVNVLMLSFGTHTGTHVDAPHHMLAGGKALDEYEVERFVRRGALLSFPGAKARYEITRDDVMRQAGVLSGGDFAILDTGWAKYYGTPEFFDHPYLGEDAAKALVELGVSLVGTDAGSVDAAWGYADALRAGCTAFDELLARVNHDNVSSRAHHVLMGGDTLIVEYLCNLGSIGRGIGTYSFLPLRIEKTDASPVRAVFMSATTRDCRSRRTVAGRGSASA